MSATRDPDRLLRAWLDLMPDEAPDRAIAAVLQATEVAPQVRRPLDLGRWRLLPMNRTSLAALAAAIIVVLAGGAFALTGLKGPAVGGPSPSPATPNPSATTTAANPLPASLVGNWFGPHLSLYGLDASAGTVLHVSDRTVTIAQSNAWQTSLLTSAVGIVDGRIQATGSICAAGDVGTYAYTLSASGQTLAISDGQDACATRLAALAGTWDLVDCKGISSNPSDAPECLGLMDAGTYGSQYYVATLAPGSTAWGPRYGGLRFTVPDGWANWSDWPQTFGLTPSADYASFDGSSDPAHRVMVFTNAMFESQDKPCSNNAATGVATTPAAIAGAIRAIAGLDVSAPAPITIDGRSGLSMDISVATAPKALCGGTDPVVEFLIAQPWNRSPSTTDVDTNGLVVGEKERLMLLDNGVGGVTAIYIESPLVGGAGAATDGFDAFAAQAMPIVQSFTFK